MTDMQPGARRFLAGLILGLIAGLAQAAVETRGLAENPVPESATLSIRIGGLLLSILALYLLWSSWRYSRRETSS